MSARLLELAGATVQVFADAPSACTAAADQIARVIRSTVAQTGRSVLGLATGATPRQIYARLIALHREGELSFANVSTYNLDEYYPITPSDSQSYRAYMQRELFDHVDLAANRAHLLDGTVPEAFVADHADQYERWISAEGGLDFQLLGVGRNGHIGFNEPSERQPAEALALRTRLVDLHPVTVADAAKDFGDPSRVIPRALTMGVATILAARSILVVALGANKAEAVALSLLGPVTPAMPGSLLQTVAAKVTWILDEPAARGLSKNR